MVEQISSLFEESMKLKDFLFHIQDEEARIELEIDNEEDYQYHHFWLSDFRSNINVAKQYRDYYVDSFSFYPEQDANTDISIHVKQKYDDRRLRQF